MINFSGTARSPRCEESFDGRPVKVKPDAGGLTQRRRRPIQRDMNDREPTPDSTLEATILSLCSEAKPGRTICPTDAALAFAAARGEGELGWRAHLQDVRRTAARLAEAGRIVIYRKGKPVDPRDFRGVYRLGAPRSE
jgi:hypothetical protein